MRAFRTIAGLSVLPFAACVSGPDMPEGLIVHDSAGVVIVENPADAELRAAEWTVGSEPVTVIGAIEGEDAYQFGMIIGVARLSDGTVAVVDVPSLEVRFFDADGQHLWTMGGPGQGPGEFVSPQGTWVLEGDTLAVWDVIQNRFTLIDASGQDAETLTPAQRPLLPVGFIQDRIVATRGPSAAVRPGDPEGIQVNREAFQRLDLEGDAPPDTVAILGEMQLLATSSGQSVGFRAVPWTVNASAGTGGGRLVVTDGIHREFRVFDSTGQLERIVRVSSQPEPVSSSSFQAELERRIANAAPDMQAEIRRQYESMPVPASVPAYTSTLVGASGEVWMEHFRPAYDGGAPVPDEASYWTVFDREGTVVATVRLPPGFDLRQIGREEVVGVHRDDLGVEYVWVLAIHQ